jgi:hypothetical protein
MGALPLKNLASKILPSKNSGMLIARGAKQRQALASRLVARGRQGRHGQVAAVYLLAVLLALLYKLSILW